MDKKRQVWFNTEKANNTYLNGGYLIVRAAWWLEIRNGIYMSWTTSKRSFIKQTVGNGE